MRRKLRPSGKKARTLPPLMALYGSTAWSCRAGGGELARAVRFVDRIVQRRQNGRLAGAQVRRVHGRVCHDEVRPASVADPGVRRSGEGWHARRPSSAWRCHHARLLSGLSEARASVVAFDMYLEDPSDCDPQFADAIRQASASGHRCGRRCKGAAASRRRDAGAGDRTPRARCRRRPVGDSRRCSVARRVGLAAPITQNAGLSLDGEVGVFPSLALRTLMHLEAQKRGGRPITAAVDHRRGLILLRDESRSLVRAIPMADEDMNMIVGVASTEELDPTRFTRSSRMRHTGQAGPVQRQGGDRRLHLR